MTDSEIATLRAASLMLRMVDARGCEDDGCGSEFYGALPLSEELDEIAHRAQAATRDAFEDGFYHGRDSIDFEDDSPPNA